MTPLPRPLISAVPRLLSLVAVPLALAACETTTGFLTPNAPPSLTLTSGPVDTVSTPQSWLVDIAWTASDPDGRIDYYEYAIDPPTIRRVTLAHAETTWVQTRENHVVARFRASHADSLGPGATASEFHVFVLRAVDDRGGKSPNVVRAFFAYTVAPDVRFTDPVPNRFFITRVGNPFRLRWEGSDPDGGGTDQPAAYRLRFLPLDGGQNVQFLVDPDSLLRLGATTGWEGWRTVGGDTTSIDVNDAGLLPNTRWLAALVAVDGAGATTPYMSLDLNLIAFEVLFAGGPAVHVFSPFIDYTGPQASLTYTSPVEIPAGRTLSFNLVGIPTAGRHITGTRWALDIANLTDPTPRSDEETDLAHWSMPRTGVVTPTFTIASPGDHELAVETFDDFGGHAILVVRLRAVAVPMHRDLLVVDDTRLEVDKISLGCPSLYTRPWPSAAELDTFLYARGGVPWRCARNPSGALSTPGLLAGYSFDTLGTRLGLENPVQGVPLSKLVQYAHVVWLVDVNSSQYGASLDPGLFPVTVLRAMSQPGVPNLIEQYVQMGGQVWLAGAGTAYASLAAFDNRSNNLDGLTVFSAREQELRPGRLLYDLAHIRSAIGVTKGRLSVTRSAAAIGGWSGHGPDGTLAAPDYSRLPAALRPRDPVTDPLPPTRLATQAALYYPTSYGAGFVLEPNVITEDFDPDPVVERLESALDTLYDVSGVAIPIPAAPVMTFYHGLDNTPFVYTGVEPWYWRREDCQGLVDFVLGDIWKLAKSPTAAATARAAAPNATRPAAPRLTRALDPRRMRP